MMDCVQSTLVWNMMVKQTYCFQQVTSASNKQKSQENDIKMIYHIYFIFKF